jgi:hypothetical protein
MVLLDCNQRAICTAELGVVMVLLDCNQRALSSALVVSDMYGCGCL